MTDQADILSKFSSAVVARTAAANNVIAAIRHSSGRHQTGILWRSDVLIASQQSLPKRDEFEVVIAGGSVVNATPAGSDPGTNIAVLKLAQSVSSAAIVPAEAKAGALALGIGADGSGHATARLGVVNQAGPEWFSSYGGRIDRRIVLDINLGRSEEGGPVFDAAGGLLGMSTFGPRRQVLVIPAATIARVVPSLLKDGRIARGWLGVALRPVAVPDALGDAAAQSSGLMVMSLADGGPAAKAGILAGDIILSVDGASTRRIRNVTARFGAESIGRNAELLLIRSGAVMSLQATITERPDA